MKTFGPKTKKSVSIFSPSCHKFYIPKLIKYNEENSYLRYPCVGQGAATHLCTLNLLSYETHCDRFSHCYGRVDECTSFAVVWEELKISSKVVD